MLSHQQLQRDPEFVALFDDLVLRVLCRITGPARDHFIDPKSKMPNLMRATNAGAAQIRESVRRLVQSGRLTRTARTFAGRRVLGIVCLPTREWERPIVVASSTLELGESDVEFLRSIGVKVDSGDVRKPVPAPNLGNGR